MGASTEELLKRLQQSHLLAPDSLSLVEEMAKKSARGKDLAIQLVKREFVTRWQAEQLLLGRTTFQLGNYVLQSKIGGGATGSVYQATDVRSGRRRAIKVLAPQLSNDREYIRRFRREVGILQKLDHPAIVRCIAAERIHDTEFLVMELVPGRDLESWIRSKGTLSPMIAAKLIEKAAGALFHLHDHGLIHRDIKPSNLIVWTDRKTKSLRLKLVDFGLARHAADDQANLTTDNTVLGSLDFMAPEQFENASTVDIRADIFSLGATLYNALTGQTLTRGTSVAEKIAERLSPNPHSIRNACPSCPKRLARVVDRCLDRDPASRFSSPQELIDALQQARTTEDDSSADLSHPASSQEQEFIPAAKTTQHVELTDDSENDLVDFLSALTTQTLTTDQTVALDLERPNETANRTTHFPWWIALVTAISSVICTLVALWVGQARLSISWPAAEQTLGSSLRVGELEVPLSATGEMSVRLPAGAYEIQFTRPGFTTINKSVSVFWGTSTETAPDWVPEQKLATRRSLQQFVSKWEQLRSARADDPRIRKLRGQVARLLAQSAADVEVRKLAQQLAAAIPSELEPRLLDQSTSAIDTRKHTLWTLFSSSHHHSGTVTGLTFSPNGKMLATAGLDGDVIVWNCEDGELEHRLQTTNNTSTATPTAIEFSPDSTRLAIGYSNGRIEVRSLRSGTVDEPLLQRGPAITSLCYSPKRGLLAVGSANRKTQIFDTRRRVIIKEIDLSHQVRGLAWTATGDRFACADVNGQTIVWGQQTGKLRTVGKGPPAGSLYFVDRDTLVMLGANGRRAEWNLAVQPTEPKISNGTFVLAAATDGSWQIERRGPFPQIQIEIPTIKFRKKLEQLPVVASYLPDRKQIAVGYDDGAIEVYETDSGQRVFGAPSPGDHWSTIAISNDGSMMSVGTKSGRVIILDAFTRRVLTKRNPTAATKLARADFVHHADRVRLLSFCYDDQVVVAYDDSSLVVTQVNDVNSHQSFAATRPVCCSARGKWVVFRRQNQLVIYNVADKSEQTVDLEGESCLAAISADGQRLAILVAASLKLVELSTGKLSSHAIERISNPVALTWVSHDTLFVTGSPKNSLVSTKSFFVSDVIQPAANGSRKFVDAGNRTVSFNDSRLVAINAKGISTPISPVISSEKTPISDFAVSPNGRTALIVEANGTVKAIELDQEPGD